jgi:hypothetical protein
MVVDTGMHGTYFFIKYLMEADRNDLIYLMTNTKDYPGWGYMLTNGATTSWEGWTGQSHIHDTLISIGAWFTEGVAGIGSDGKSPGFKHFVIKPAVVGDLRQSQVPLYSRRYHQRLADRKRHFSLECYGTVRDNRHRVRARQGRRRSRRWRVLVRDGIITPLCWLVDGIFP